MKPLKVQLRTPHLLLSLPMFLAGCATSSTYRDLVADFEVHEHTDYYRSSVSSPTYERVAQPPPAIATDDMPGPTPGEASKTMQGDRTSPAPAPELDDDQLAAPVHLDLLLSLLPTRNPDVLAAHRNVQATLEQHSQTAYLDTILNQYNAFTKQLDTRIGRQKHKSMVAMTFPFPDTLALKGKIVTEDAEIAQRQVEIALRDAEAAMRTAFYEYTYVDAAIAVNRENQDLLEQAIAVAQTKVRVDQGSYNAVIMAQVELSQLADEIANLTDRRSVAAARINTLLSRSTDAPLGPAHPEPDTELASSFDEVLETAVRDRQELRQHRLRIQRMSTVVELATRMAYPDPSTGASSFEDRMRVSSGTEPGAPPFVTTRTPDSRQTPWFGQRDSYIREMKTRIAALQEALVGMEDWTRLDVKQAYVALDTARRRAALYRESLLAQARQAFDAASAGYRAGKTDFLTVLDAQRTLLKFRLAEQRSRRDVHTQLARLDQLAGYPLARRSADRDR